MNRKQVKRQRGIHARQPLRLDISDPDGEIQTIALRGRQDDLNTLVAVLKVFERATSEKVWRCFHCDEAFTDAGLAALHFGRTEIQKPACQVSATDLRELERELARYREEDTDLHRAIHAAESKDVEAARNAEEKGYARGLADAKKHPGELGLMPVAERTEFDDGKGYIEHRQYRCNHGTLLSFRCGLCAERQ